MSTLLFTTGFIIAFIISSYVSGHYEGHKKENGLFFRIGEYNIHIHHWLWTGAILLIMIYFKIYTPIILGIFAGSTAQGLTYRDKFIVIYKTKDFEKIYNRFKNPHWGTHIRRHARILKK